MGISDYTMSNVEDITGAYKSLTEEEVGRHAKQFMCIDVDGSHFIDREEAKENLKKLHKAIMGNPPPEDEWHQRLNKEVDDMFSKMDENHDNKISFEEYLDCYAAAKDLQAERSWPVIAVPF